MKRTRTTPVILALAAMASLLAATGCDKFKSREELRAGNELFKAGKYDTALARYQHALQLDPGATEIYRNIGLAYMGLYQPGSKHPQDIEYSNKAIEYLKKYAEAHPDDPKGPQYLVTMYLNSGRIDDALTFYQGYVQQHPKDPKLLQSMANLYFQKADFPNGVAYMEKAMQITGPTKEGYEAIGAAAWDKAHNFPDLTDDQRQQIITQGTDALNKALQIDPNYPEALSFINLLYREQAKLDQKTDPKKAEQDIAQADTYRNKAIELFKERQAKKAGESGPTGTE